MPDFETSASVISRHATLLKQDVGMVFALYGNCIFANCPGIIDVKFY